MNYFKTNDGRKFYTFKKLQIRTEAQWFNKDCYSLALEFSIADEHESTLVYRFAFPFICSLWLIFEFSPFSWFERYCGKYQGLNYGFYANKQSFHAEWHQNTMSWKQGDWTYHLEWSDLFKGKPKYSSKTIYEGIYTVNVPGNSSYPQKDHDFLVRKKQFITKFPRWFSTSGYKWEVVCKDGIAHPGKGTASYNCGDDALISTSFIMTDEINTAEKAIDSFIKSALNNREKYPL